MNMRKGLTISLNDELCYKYKELCDLFGCNNNSELIRTWIENEYENHIQGLKKLKEYHQSKADEYSEKILKIETKIKEDSERQTNILKKYNIPNNDLIQGLLRGYKYVVIDTHRSVDAFFESNIPAFRDTGLTLREFINIAEIYHGLKEE